jgi:hypothetical protein
MEYIKFVVIHVHRIEELSFTENHDIWDSEFI